MDKILWEIPIGILNQANHVFLWQAGAKLRRFGRERTKSIADMAKAMGIDS